MSNDPKREVVITGAMVARGAALLAIAVAVIHLVVSWIGGAGLLEPITSHPFIYIGAIVVAGTIFAATGDETKPTDEDQP